MPKKDWESEAEALSKGGKSAASEATEEASSGGGGPMPDIGGGRTLEIIKNTLFSKNTEMSIDDVKDEYGVDDRPRAHAIRACHHITGADESCAITDLATSAITHMAKQAGAGE